MAQRNGPSFIRRILIGALVGAILGAIVGLIWFVGDLIVLSFPFRPSASAPSVSEWSARAAAPAADTIDVEWKCEFRTGNEARVRDGKVVPSSTGTLIVREQAERVSCSLWKRSPGRLVAVLYRGDTVSQRVESTANTDLILLSGSIR